MQQRRLPASTLSPCATSERRLLSGGGMIHRPVDDVIAVEVELADGGRRFFVTWGRIQDAVDPNPVCEVVMRFAQGPCGGQAVRAQVCSSLREAAESSDAPYFYEALLTFSGRRPPFDGEYESWRQERAAAMRAGKEIFYCGAPEATL